ncbi:hypothetical protein ACH4CE_37410 [Streptomyces gelaticus]|uniref:hypothetical protein n=1 Tax=Streptomyces gelaticus TaxID=285446 RepID=UPI00378DCF4F
MFPRSDGFKQVLVAVGGPVRIFFGALDDAVVGDISLGGAVDDAEVCEASERLEVRAPQPVLEGGFGDERDAGFQEHLERTEEGVEGGVVEGVVVVAALVAGAGQDHALLDLVADDRRASAGMGSSYASMVFPVPGPGTCGLKPSRCISLMAPETL